MTQQQAYALCIRNEGYPASLEVRKLYRVLPNAQECDTRHIRVIDESDEDCLYPAAYFVTLDLPRSVKEAIEIAT